MPDYNDQHLTPIDPLHHVEGLVSLSDRVARRKEEQQRRRRNKERQDQQEPTDSGSSGPPESGGPEDGHIDFRA
jgi:hypothetical protein